MKRAQCLQSWHREYWYIFHVSPMHNTSPKVLRYKRNCKWYIPWRSTQNLPRNFFYLQKPDSFTAHAYMIQNMPKKMMPSLSRFSRTSTELQVILLYRISPTSDNKYVKHGYIHYAPQKYLSLRQFSRNSPSFNKLLCTSPVPTFLQIGRKRKKIRTKYYLWP